MTESENTPPEPAQLTQAKLEEIYQELISSGAAKPLTSSEGTPFFLFSDIDENGHSPTRSALLNP